MSNQPRMQSFVESTDFTDFYPQEQPWEEERPAPSGYNHNPQQQYSFTSTRGQRGGHAAPQAARAPFPHSSPYRGDVGRGRGAPFAGPRGRGRGRGVPFTSPPPRPTNSSYFPDPASFMAPAVPIQPPAFPVKDEEGEKEPLVSPKRPPVFHLASRQIRRTNAPPLTVNIFHGALCDFLEEQGSDVVLASSFKNGFRTANAPTSFCSAAQACGIDVTKLDYKDMLSADYNLHMLETEQCCGALWLVELKQSSEMSPFKPKDLVGCYDMLKLHSREIIQAETESLTMTLIGKGAKANFFEIGRNEVIVELVGFLHWIAENMPDRPNLAAINIVSSNDFTAQALQGAIDLLIPVQIDKLEEFLRQAQNVAAKVMEKFEAELKKLEQADKEERLKAKEEPQNGDEDGRLTWERKAAQREKREVRKKLTDVVTNLRIIHKSVENIVAAVKAFKFVHEVSIIIVACAVNGRIVAEICSELFLLEDGLFRRRPAQPQQQQPQDYAAGRGFGRGRGGAPPFDAGRGRGAPFAPHFGAPPPAHGGQHTMDQNLFGRMTQLKASGRIDKPIYHHFQTLRLVGNKAVHSTVLTATTVDLGAIVLAVHGLLTCPLFSS